MPIKRFNNHHHSCTCFPFPMFKPKCFPERYVPSVCHFNNPIGLKDSHISADFHGVRHEDSFQFTHGFNTIEHADAYLLSCKMMTLMQ